MRMLISKAVPIWGQQTSRRAFKNSILFIFYVPFHSAHSAEWTAEILCRFRQKNAAPYLYRCHCAREPFKLTYDIMRWCSTQNAHRRSICNTFKLICVNWDVFVQIHLCVSIWVFQTLIYFVLVFVVGYRVACSLSCVAHLMAYLIFKLYWSLIWTYTAIQPC